MYSSGQAAIGKIGPSDYRAGRKRPPRRRRPEEKSYSACGRCNAFLSQRIPLIAPDRVTRDTEGKNFNYLNKPNYEYLLDSARRYAELAGQKIEHYPEDSPGAGIISVYSQLKSIVGNDIEINIQPNGARLEFVLWDRYEWGEHSLYWIPLEFIGKLPPKFKRLVISFFHQFNKSMKFGVPDDQDGLDWIMEWKSEVIGNSCEDDDDRKEAIEDLENYTKGGRIYRFLERIKTRNYYKDLHRALAKYEPQTEYERKLVALMQEGMKFIGGDVPTIFRYAYDEYYDEDDYEDCVEMEQRFMFVYSFRDSIMQGYIDYLNDIAGNYHEVFPCATLILSPDTDTLLTKDAFPGELFGYLDKLREFIDNNNYEPLQQQKQTDRGTALGVSA